MNNQRLISDARRRARARSRETAEPYQSILEVIASEAGRSSWSAFVMDPTPPLPPDKHAATASRFDPDGADWDRWIRAADHAGRGAMLLGLIMVGTVLAIPNLVPLRSDHAIWFITGMGGLGLFLVALSLWSPATASLQITMASRKAPRSAGPRRIALLWAGLTTKVFGILLLAQALTAYGPLVMSGATAATIDAVQRDASTHRHVWIEDLRRELAIANSKTVDGHADLTLVAIDMRMQPRPMRSVSRAGNERADRLSSLMRDHPVLRLAGRLDCSTGRLSPTRIEIADSYASPAVHTELRTARSGQDMAIGRDDTARICGNGGREAP